MKKLLRALRPIVFNGRILEPLTIFECPLWLALEFIKYDLCDAHDPPEEPHGPYGEVAALSLAEPAAPRRKKPSKKEGSR